MSAAGILANNLATHYPIDYNTSTSSTSSPPNNNLRFHIDLGQLGEDLQSGNLAAAQQDFAALQFDGLQTSPSTASSSTASGSSSSTSVNSTTATESNNPVTQAFNQLAVDLQAGNLSAAQQDYSNIQQDFQNQNQTQTGEPHFHHERHTGGVSEMLDQLGQQLQSNNLSTAQQTYGSFLQNAAYGQLQPAADSNGVSINV